MKKEKIFELKIEEEDEVSGIDSISLVDEPAIMVNWIAFKKEDNFKKGVPHYTKDGKLYTGPTHKDADGRMMTGKVHTDDSEYLYHEDELAEDKNGNIKASPKAPNSDTKNPNPKGEGSAKGSASGKKGAVVSAENEATLQNKVKEFNEKETNTKNGKASLGALKSVFQRGLGAYNTSRSPVVRSAEQWAFARVNAFLYLLKNGRPENPKYDTDYDLLPNKHPKAQMSSQDFIDCKKCDHSWDVEDGGDDPYMCNKCDTDNTPEEDMKKMDNPCWEGYEPVGLKPDGSPNCVPKKDMSRILDYPESIKNNAKSVLKYVEENGWGECGTAVGKRRANQLANGEPISIDTVKRMYSYLSRHERDLRSSKSYDDGCGKLMYNSWGGKSALRWAERQVQAFDYDVSGLPTYVDELPKKKSYDNNLINFAADNEKHIVLGPAMVPDQKIFRKDEQGNPYYVFFSAETIKMICEKYMKNKYIDNNDQMHDGKAVKDVFVVESWIKEDDDDKSNKYGFKDLPVGTWFVSMKINNPKVWDKVKNGELNGFSVSGYFEEVADFTKEQMFLYKVVEVLSRLEE